MKNKTRVNDFVQEPYNTGYKKASYGKWEYEQYWRMSHLELRKAYPAKRRRSQFDAVLT